MPGQMKFKRGNRLLGAFHHVVPGSAMNMHIDEAWSEYVVSEIYHRSP